MEYDFIREKDGSYSVELSMEHQPIAQWINTELSDDSGKITDIIRQIKDIKPKQLAEKKLVGQEYSLLLTPEEVEVTANSLHHKTDIYDDLLQEDDLHEDDNLSRAMCGLEDLQYLLEDWLDFIQR